MWTHWVDRYGFFTWRVKNVQWICPVNTCGLLDQDRFVEMSKTGRTLFLMEFIVKLGKNLNIYMLERMCAHDLQLQIRSYAKNDKRKCYSCGQGGRNWFWWWSWKCVFKFLKIIFRYVLLCMWVCKCMDGCPWRPEVSDPWELELGQLWGTHGRAGNWTWALCKNSACRWAICLWEENFPSGLTVSGKHYHE